MGFDVANTVSKANIQISSTNRGYSMPWGQIRIPQNDSFQGGYNPNRRSGPSETGRIGLETHELWHQYQYKTDFLAFPKLGIEQLNYSLGTSDPYFAGDPVNNPDILTNIRTLFDIPTLEGQAQFVGQWNADVYQYLSGGDVDMDRLLKEAKIILQSGFKSQAASDLLLLNDGRC